LLVDAFRLSYVELPATPTGTPEVIGTAVFRHYVLPFEVVSVLLLAALIGALVLSRPDVSTAGQR
jgi:NADH-quinone oxidoreductase subunit J/NAD(P)H-quinone oxidoreductase subunit 6